MSITPDNPVFAVFGDTFQGHPLSLQTLGPQQWLAVLTVTPSQRLLLSVESDLSRRLDELGLSDEIKLGLPDLDARYVIRADDSSAQELLRSTGFGEFVRQLEPFVELELTGREYRLIKEDFPKTPPELEGILTSLLGLAQATRQPEGSAP